MLSYTPFYKSRVKMIPPLPRQIEKAFKEKIESRFEIPNTIDSKIDGYFPNLLGKRRLESKQKLRVGVVLSGGQAPGGHNVICGLLDGIKRLSKDSTLLGFLNGPSGIVENKIKELNENYVADFLNTGGFDMIGSGRTKIESEEQFEGALKAVKVNQLDALVVIGGDDSNTNAALLAEYFLAHNQPTAVIGVPKTIDGDLKNKDIEQSFGFDTAAKTYSASLGNILKDVLSSQKYWFFTRLMGRTASHITFEVALQTRPNLTLISEEHRTLEDILNDITTLIIERAKIGKNYGVILIPEGIIEFIPSLPKETFEGMNVSYDSHGNLEVSKLDTERVFIELIKKRIPSDIPFSPMPLFLGYEGRSAYPSYFDACYTYSLGHVAALLASQGATGQMATVNSLKKPVEEWGFKGISLLSLFDLEERKGTMKPVIKKALLNIEGPQYLEYKRTAEQDRMNDNYRSPGPIQYWGPAEIVDSRTLSD